MTVQGSQDPVLLLFLEPSYALLLNRSGHAEYDAHKINTVTASVPGSQDAADVVGVTPFQFDYSAIQGSGSWNGAAAPVSGEGALIDLGGPGSSFSAVQSNEVTTSPDSGRSFASGAFWTPMQGHGNGGVFVAAGQGPVISASPANGVCAASPFLHGGPLWTDCTTYIPPGTDPDRVGYDFLGGNGNPGYGTGFAPMIVGTPVDIVASAPLGDVPDDSAAPVSATLSSGGSPLAGAPVHFDLQLGIPIPRGLGAGDGTVIQWLNISQSEGVTDASGVAHSVLPLGLRRMFGLQNGPEGWFTRLMVTFDGAPGLQPRHVVAPLNLTAPPSEAS
jgi:hypothetical protein